MEFGSVRPSVLLSVCKFSWNWVIISFFLNSTCCLGAHMGLWVTARFFFENPLWAKITKKGPKICVIRFGCNLFRIKTLMVQHVLQKLYQENSGSQVVGQNTFSFNQFAELFDHQYLWKESINILYFLCGGSHQEKVASLLVWYDHGYPVMPKLV